MITSSLMYQHHTPSTAVTVLTQCRTPYTYRAGCTVVLITEELGKAFSPENYFLWSLPKFSLRLEKFMPLLKSFKNAFDHPFSLRSFHYLPQNLTISITKRYQKPLPCFQLPILPFLRKILYPTSLKWNGTNTNGPRFLHPAFFAPSNLTQLLTWLHPSYHLTRNRILSLCTAGRLHYWGRPHTVVAPII